MITRVGTPSTLFENTDKQEFSWEQRSYGSNNHEWTQFVNLLLFNFIVRTKRPMLLFYVDENRFEFYKNITAGVQLKAEVIWIQ